jgi:hypothetical protein
MTALMLANRPFPLQRVRSGPGERLMVQRASSTGPLPAAPQWLTDLERWVNEGGHGDDPDAGPDLRSPLTVSPSSLSGDCR